MCNYNLTKDKSYKQLQSIRSSSQGIMIIEAMLAMFLLSISFVAITKCTTLFLKRIRTAEIPINEASICNNLNIQQLQLFHCAANDRNWIVVGD